MLETPRGMAVEILNRVTSTDAYAEPLLDAYLSSRYLPNIHDRRLLTELVYGVLRMRGYLDWLIGTYYRGSLSSLQPVVTNIIRVGLYQLIYTKRIPVFAIVDEAVKLAKVFQPESAALVNAILRTYLRKKETLIYPQQEDDPATFIAVIHSHPRWLVQRWLKAYGATGTIALCEANNRIPPVFLRTNRLKTTRDQAILELKAEGIDAVKTVYSPDGLLLSGHTSSLRRTTPYKEGHFLVQDEASQLITLLLAPRPGEHVLDLCAGTGVKTTHLAEIMENSGSILAVDSNSSKLASLREFATRLGATIVETRTADTTKDMDRDLRESFDRILVDAPCSGLGTVRRNPEIKWRRKAGELNDFAVLQKRMLSVAASALKRGGVIVYSVCTVTPEENEGVIADFLSHHRNFRSVPAPETIDRNMIDAGGYFRSRPDIHNTDGFFAAVMVKDRIGKSG